MGFLGLPESIRESTKATICLSSGLSVLFETMVEPVFVGIYFGESNFSPGFLVGSTKPSTVFPSFGGISLPVGWLPTSVLCLTILSRFEARMASIVVNATIAVSLV